MPEWKKIFSVLYQSKQSHINERKNVSIRLGYSTNILCIMHGMTDARHWKWSHWRVFSLSDYVWNSLLKGQAHDSVLSWASFIYIHYTPIVCKTSLVLWWNINSCAEPKAIAAALVPLGVSSLDYFFKTNSYVQKYLSRVIWGGW